MKNAGDADIQHCFEKAEGVEVVESYVAKSDMEIEGQPIKKGTWLMTMEVSDDDVWDKIEKGEITGFSMGGKGSYSEVDVDISDPDNPVEKAGGKKGIMKALASLFGMDVVEKGAVKENYQRRIIRDNFWSAFYSLSDYLLETYNPETGRFEPVHDDHSSLVYPKVQPRRKYQQSVHYSCLPASVIWEPKSKGLIGFVFLIASISFSDSIASPIPPEANKPA